MAQTETFDPKRYTPFEPGVPVEQVLSTFPAIDTAVDQHQVHAGAGADRQRHGPRRAHPLVHAADLGFILHSRHQYHWHTGYIPPQPMAMPHIGAVISRTLGPRNPDMPAFIAIGQTVEGAGEIGTLKAFHTAGFLGTEHGPFLIVDPAGRGVGGAAAEELGERVPQPAAAVPEAARAGARLSHGSDFQRESLVRSLDAADRLLTSPSAKAFDLSLEPTEASTPTTPAASGRAACWRAGWSKPAPATSR